MKTDEQQTALREPRYSIGWSMDERSLYLTDHVEDDHVVIVKFTENWTNETKRKTLRALVDIADALAGEGACRDIALLDAPAQGAPPAGWQPIETAPADRIVFIARDMGAPFGWTLGTGFLTGMGWVTRGIGEVVADGLGLAHPTHWMPLPPAPRPEGRPAEGGQP